MGSSPPPPTRLGVRKRDLAGTPKKDNDGIIYGLIYNLRQIAFLERGGGAQNPPEGVCVCHENFSVSGDVLHRRAARRLFRRGVGQSIGVRDGSFFYSHHSYYYQFWRRGGPRSTLPPAPATDDDEDATTPEGEGRYMIPSLLPPMFLPDLRWKPPPSAPPRPVRVFFPIASDNVHNKFQEKGSSSFQERGGGESAVVAVAVRIYICARPPSPSSPPCEARHTLDRPS